MLLGADERVLPARVRLLKPADVWSLVAADVAAALAPALQRVERSLGPPTDCAAALDSFAAMYWSFRYLQGREAWQVDGPFIERFAPPLGPGVAERFAFAKAVTDEQVATSGAFRERYREHLTALLGSDGVLVLPTMPDIAPLLSASDAQLEEYRNRAIEMLSIAGLAGFPQVTLPLARRHDAPLGISLLGPAGSDRSVVALAERIVND